MRFKYTLSSISPFLKPVLCFTMLFTFLVFLWGNRGTWLQLYQWHLIYPTETFQGVQWLTGPVLLPSILTLILSRRFPSGWITVFCALVFAFYLHLPLRYKFFPSQQSPSAAMGTQLAPLLIRGQSSTRSFPSAHALGIAVLGTGLAWLYRNNKRMQRTLAVTTTGLAYLSIFNGLSFPADVLISLLLGVAVTIFVIAFYGPIIISWYQRRGELIQDILVAMLRTISISFIMIQLQEGIHL